MCSVQTLRRFPICDGPVQTRLLITHGTPSACTSLHSVSGIWDCQKKLSDTDVLKIYPGGNALELQCLEKSLHQTGGRICFVE